MNSNVCPLDLDPPFRTVPEMKGSKRGSHLATGTERASLPTWLGCAERWKQAHWPSRTCSESGPGAFNAT